MDLVSSPCVLEKKCFMKKQVTESTSYRSVFVEGSLTEVFACKLCEYAVDSWEVNEQLWCG